MKKKINYIALYNPIDSYIKRDTAISGMLKIDYICDSFNRAGFDVNIVSPAWISDSEKTCFQKKQMLQINNSTTIDLGPSFNVSYKWALKIKIAFSLFWLFLWLILNVKRNEKILVYHTQWFSIPLRLAKKIKKFNLILEVEEIYSEVWEINKTLQKWEKKLIESADSYIAVSDVLAKILGKKTKVVVYGSYKVSKNCNTSEKANPNLKNVIYAGSIDTTKGGAYQAVNCARYLPKNYIIHICGHGSKETKEKLIKQIKEINTTLGREACIYHGLLPVEELDALLNSCQIAINPQFDGVNMKTLFPSKILKYLAHNLRVVSTRIESVEKSKISSLITFSENDTPEANAKAILNIDITKTYDSTIILKKLDDCLVKEIKKLMI